MRAAAAAVLCAVTAMPALADDAAAIDRLLDFASNGCVASIIGARPLEDFAAGAGAIPADESLAKNILGDEPGAAYHRRDPDYPLVLAGRPAGPCTVNGKFPSGLDMVAAAVEDFFAGPGGGFYLARAFEEQAAAGGWTTHRIFVGRRRGKALTLLFSTTPAATTFDQVTIVLAER